MGGTATGYGADPGFNEDPREWLRKFLWVGMICLAAILVLATYGIFRVFSWRLVESADGEARGICHIVLVKEKRHMLLFDGHGVARLELGAGRKEALDKRISEYLEPFPVERMRIWDAEHRVVYSIGSEMDGRGVAVSPELDRALKGETVSRLEKGFYAPVAGKIDREGGDQVVSYLPIRGRNKVILGAMEIRRNVAGYRAEIRRGVIFSAAVLGTVLLALFACVFLLVKRGADRLARAHKALRILATTDFLTGVFNRREALSLAEQSFSRRQKGNCGKTPENFGCLMLDFDNFKTINDTYGHPAGDLVLQQLAVRFRTVLRPYDIVGRFGGEEFLVILPDTSLEQCRDIAERLRKAVREKPFDLGGPQIFGSISIGGASAYPMDRDFEAILHRADEGLCRAKNLGKDCAVWMGDHASGACGPGNFRKSFPCRQGAF
jgi:diguanylate cyclase (GGDEF)-like protein